MRLACVYVPQLALQAALRREPEARDAGAVLLAGEARRTPRVTELDTAAHVAWSAAGLASDASSRAVVMSRAA